MAFHKSASTRKKHKAVRKGGLRMIIANRHQAHNLQRAKRRSGRP